MKKRILIFFTSLCLVFTMIVAPVQAVFAVDSDIVGHWAESAIRSFVEAGVLSGNGFGQYSPNSPMTRAQFAAVINRLAGLIKESAEIGRYTDVSSDDWYYSDMAKALEAGYMLGTSESTMSPNEPVTREQAIVMIARFLKLETANVSVLDAFEDATSVSDWAKKEVAALVSAGYVQGYAGKLRPDAPLTRAEGVTILSRVQDMLEVVAIADEDVALSGVIKNNDAGSVVDNSLSGGSSNSSTGSGSSTGGGADSNLNQGGGSQSAPVLLNADNTKIVDLGWIQFVSIAFANGYNIENTTVKIDGVDVTEALTRVTDDGSIAKWELAALSPAKIEVSDKKDSFKSQTVKLSDGEPTVPAVKTATSPAYILTHGAVPVWDYQLTNFDINGNARVNASKTTFDLDAVTSATVGYSPAAELKKVSLDVNKYEVGGEVKILFNYKTDAQKAWFDGISEEDALWLLKNDERNVILNKNLEYTKSTEEHHGSTVGVLTIAIGQENFFSNGRYNVRIESKGGQTVVQPIHVVNEKAPELLLDGVGALKSGQKINFKVKNMLYGILNPIEEVRLTDPKGEMHTLENIRDYYLIGDLFVLYSGDIYENGAFSETINNIPYDGKYTIKIYANGFKMIEKSFTVVDGESAVQPKRSAAPRRAGGIDAVSGATSGGGSSTGSGSGSGGGLMMSADLLFNADLLANALLITKLGIENPAANGIAARWENDITRPDAVYSEDGKVFYTWTGYYNAVQDAKTAGRYLSFAEYVESGEAEITKNRPYAVKEVLEDNLLGAVQYGGSYKGKKPPVIKTLELEEGADAVFSFSGEDDVEYAEYLASITQINKYGAWKPLTEEQMSIDAESATLTIYANVLSLGNNDFVLKASGYKDNMLRISVKKKLEEGAEDIEFGAEMYYTGDKVVLVSAGESGDYFKGNLSLTLTNPENEEKQIYRDGVESISEDIGYSIERNRLTLGGGLFKTAGEYTLKIVTEHYGDQEMYIIINEREEGDEPGGSATPDDPTTEQELKNPPSNPKVYKSFTGEFVIEFGMDNDDWAKAIEGIVVGDKEYNAGPAFRPYTYRTTTTDAIITLGADGFTNDENPVVINAKGYEPCALVISKDGKLVEGVNPIEPGENEGQDDEPSGEDEPPVVHQGKTPPQAANLKKLLFLNNYRLSFSATNAGELDAYLGSGSVSVELGGEQLKRTSYLYAEKSFKITAENGNNTYIDFSEDCFNGGGEVDVVVRVDGYQDLKFTVKNGEIVK